MALSISDRDRKYFEETGAENVRIALQTNTNLAISDRGAAWRWLKEQDEENAKSKSRYERFMFWLTLIGSSAAIVAAVASVWPLIK